MLSDPSMISFRQEFSLACSCLVCFADLAATELIEEVIKSAEQVFTPNQKESPVSIVDDDEDMPDAQEEEETGVSLDTASSKTQ